MAKDTALWIDGVAGSELRDSQGETLSVEGADISDLEAGRGRWNDNHGKGFFNSIGRVTEAKKIFKAEDCENDRHRYYWEQIKAPYIYAAGYLYNDEDHPNAKAAAAILRNIHKSDCPLKIKASVEGGVISRGIKDPSRLERTKIHSIAITFTPANKATLIEPLHMEKSIDQEQDAVDQELIKSVMHLAEENVPSFRHVQRNAQASRIINNIEKIKELAKATGINITIEETNPEQLIKSALEAKILNNVKKINNLMKQFNGDKLTEAVRAKRFATAQVKKPSGILTTPPGPGKDITPVQSARQVKATNTFKIHANRANKDPKYLDNLRQQLTDKGIDNKRINLMVDRISQHLEKDEGDIEKGEIRRALTGLAGTAALAVAAQNIGKTPETTPKSAIKEPVPQEKVIPHSEKKIEWDVRKPIDPKGAYRKPTLKERLDRAKKLKNKEITKALYAGYGGSGSPTDATGGAVIQSESLEDNNKKEGFQYITCKNCGKEQIYHKNQVKCRDCSKNFSLKDLYKLIAK